MYQIERHKPPVHPVGREEVIIYEQRPYWWQRYWADEEPDRRNKQPGGFWCKVCTGLAVLFALAFVGVCIAFAVKSNSSSTTASLKNGGATKENCFIATYKAVVSMDDMTYKDEYKYSNNPEFDSLAKEFCNSLKENMEDLYECGEEVDSCRVDNFEPGSVKVNMELRHTKIGKAENVKEAEIEKETERISDVVNKAILDGQGGSNENNLFKKESTTLLDVKATDIKEYVQCAPVKTPRFGRILSLSPFVNYIDDQITVKCEDGYYFPDGTNLATITCLSSGEWNRELPDCEPKTCPDVPDTVLVNSEIKLGKATGNTFKDTVWIQCNHGFTFDLDDVYDRDRVVGCRKDRTWDKPLETGCQDFDECASAPCANGGTCSQETPGGYVCNCPEGYTGTQCETDIDYCEGVECQNGGTCCDEVTGFKCFCAPGFTGENCESDIDECEVNPCLNGGTCHDEVNGYTCSCPDFFTGRQCEYDIDDCEPSPCQNGGTCYDGINEYFCSCPGGFTGQQCEADDACDSSPCQNGGTCLNGVNQFSCCCDTFFWTGALCETAND